MEKPGNRFRQVYFCRLGRTCSRVRGAKSPAVGSVRPARYATFNRHGIERRLRATHHFVQSSVLHAPYCWSGRGGGTCGFADFCRAASAAARFPRAAASLGSNCTAIWKCSMAFSRQSFLKYSTPRLRWVNWSFGLIFSTFSKCSMASPSCCLFCLARVPNSNCAFFVVRDRSPPRHGTARWPRRSCLALPALCQDCCGAMSWVACSPRPATKASPHLSNTRLGGTRRSLMLPGPRRQAQHRPRMARPRASGEGRDFLRFPRPSQAQGRATPIER